MNLRSLKFRLILWYTLAVGAIFVLSGALLYVGLRRYLETGLGRTQQQRALRIAAMVERAKLDNGRSLTDEIVSRFAPEASGRFIRVSRADGTILYQSNAPHDQSFDPSGISPPAHLPGTRKERLGDGTELVVATVATKAPGGTGILVETGESLAPALVELRRLMISLGLASVAVAGVALGGGLLLVRRALRPVEEITRSAERITSHNLTERLPVSPTGDEFEHLSQALNRMITRLDEAFQHNRRFLADASHELRTPLTVLRGELEGLVQEARIAPEYRERLGNVLEEVERLTSLVEGLFAIARLDAGEGHVWTGQFDLGQLTASTAEQMSLLAEDKHIRVACTTTPGVWVEGDRSRLKQVVVNLLDNAIKYTPEGGSVGLTVAAQDGRAVIEVADTGIGIPSAALPRVFDRFFRVDEARSREQGGAGLGLSIVKSICVAHGGQVTVNAKPGKGSCFRVELPLTPAQREPTSGFHEL